MILEVVVKYVRDAPGEVPGRSSTWRAARNKSEQLRFSSQDHNLLLEEKYEQRGAVETSTLDGPPFSHK